jgi:hypothetical protein
LRIALTGPIAAFAYLPSANTSTHVPAILTHRKTRMLHLQRS